ncbi:MAG: M28 family metallopeptidase [Brevefilum sp.]
MEWQKLIEKLIQIIIALLVSVGLMTGPSETPSLIEQTTPLKPESTATLAEPITPTLNTFLTPTAIPPTITPTKIPHYLRPDPGSVCSYDPQTEALMAGLDQAGWVHWIELLSGKNPVKLNGETYTILTRYSESMFSGNPRARAYEFVLEQVRQWGYQDGVDLFEQEYQPFANEPETIWKNIILLIPGKDPEIGHEQILLTAHLDSISQGRPEAIAPGADDNGSGVATLLEAAQLFQNLNFRRTIKIVFFTGEEQGLLGSQSYVNHYQHEMENILGVFNLDMFGYDSDNDRCFEIHVGRLPESNLTGGCLADIIEGHKMELKFEYINEDAIGASDHANFWQEGVGAIEVGQNFLTNDLPNGCGQRDFNPYYHSENDRIENMNLDMGHAIARAAIGAVARMAELSKD